MRRKNQGIYQFILDLERKKDRERALRQRLLKGVGLERTEELGFESGVPEPIEIGERKKEASKVEILEFERMDHRLRIKLGTSVVMATCSLISVIVLLQIDALMRQNLVSSEFHWVFELATLYWLVFNTELGAFWLAVIAALLLKMHMRR